MTNEIKAKIQNAINNLNIAKKNLNKIAKEEPEKTEKQLNKVARFIISRWYGTYEPFVYRRTGSLDSAYKIKRDFLNFEVDYNSEYMNEGGYSHHQSNEIVFNNSFMNGYHGGSWGTSKANGETVNSPYWRTPVGKYTYWYIPAPQSFSPYELIEKYTQEVLDNYDSTLNRKLNRQVGYYIGRI